MSQRRTAMLCGTAGLTRSFALLLCLSSPALITGCSKSKPQTAPSATQPVQTPAAAESTQLSGQPAQGESPTDDELLARGKQLYGSYCAACHGETGDGSGPAARFLYPKPRNFRDGKFRLVSTQNRVPSDDDIMHVISRGMPGSAMFPFEHLSEAERKTLVAYVRQLTRSGVDERLRRVAAEAGDELDPAELTSDVTRMTTPGACVEFPSDLHGGEASVARGRQLYLKQGCASCHGETGKGDGVQDQRDDDGMPISPRDYTRGIFKGGRDSDQLYARTFLGMPGTPMPSSSNLKPEEIGDMVHYLQSLSEPAAQDKVTHKRTRLIVKRSDEPLSDEISAAVWNSVAPKHVVVSPLWWRNYDDFDLQVQAMHDGQSVVIRLTWHDETNNEQAVRPQEFVDMAAVQLFRGEREPFLGMGAKDGGVDMWLWQAGQQADPGARFDVDTAYPDMAVDLYPFEQEGNGSRPHATRNQSREFVSAWAAGNLRSDPTGGLPANALQAKGFGSLTMLPRVSQVVNAAGGWSDGRWTVVVRRPLEVSADSGIQLAAGDKLSIAFAIWDGAARDRNGQKLVSIWHDFELENER
jgi:mono/diheme cytochrome c family protein